MTKTTTEESQTTLQKASLATMTDEQLVLGYRDSSDPTLLEALVQRYERELYNYLRRFLGDALLAEDVFQNTFMQVHLKCHLFDGKRRVRPWLYTIATNQAIDMQRRNKRHQLVSLDRPQRASHAEVGNLINLLESGEASLVDRFDVREKVEWLRSAIAALPEQLATTLRLVYFRGMKHREAAEELAIPVGTVKSRLHSAVQQLGAEWNRTHDDR